jgi:predicted enzyme related to lactoylglutathione lyase
MFEKLHAKPPAKPHVSSRVRAYGRARIDIARRAVTAQDWDQMWKPPQNAFPFTWGKYWKQCIEYRVDDFAAEVGFFIDVLGFPILAFDASYAMFTSPAGEFTFSVVQTPEGISSTPPDAIRIQFMVQDIDATTEELSRRGILFTQNPEPLSEGSTMYAASFLTPHGICIDVWGEARQASEDVVEAESVEDEISEAEEVDQQSKKPSPEKVVEQELDIDDLFEEIHDEPEDMPKFKNQNSSIIQADAEEDPDEDSLNDVQYIDVPEVDYPEYKPIPFRR